MTSNGFFSWDSTNANDSNADADGLFLKLEVPGYDGTNRTSYLYLGEWRSASGGISPIVGNKLAELVDTDGDGYADYIKNGTGGYYQNNAGSDNAAAYHTDGQPNLDQNGTSSLGVTPQADGDDLLWAFAYNRFYDDSRDRDDNDYNNAEAPSTGYAPIAEPPDDSLGNAAAPFNSDLRKTITNDIPSYVGWRDHTEGHRITTTRGDKIEVIGGNYKLLVLGRGTGTVHTDWSGGHVADTMEAAGNVTSVNFRKVPVSGESSTDCGWQWVEEVIKGNVIERFHGTYKEEIYGDELTTIIGHSNAADGGLENASAINAAVDEPGYWDDSAGNKGEEDNLWDSLQGHDFKLMRPEIIEKVRASSVCEVEHVDGVAVDIDCAKKAILEYVGCKPDSWSGNAVSVSSETANVSWSDDYKPSNFHEYIQAGEIRREAEADRIDERIKVDEVRLYYGEDSDYIDVWEHWWGVHDETFVGSHTQFFSALYTTLAFTQRFKIFFLAELQLNLVGVWTISLGQHAKFRAPFAWEMGFAWKWDFFLNKTKASLLAQSGTFTQRIAAVLRRNPTLLMSRS